MTEEAGRFDLKAVLTLREVRGLIRRSSFRGAVVLFGLLYVLGSLFESGMVLLARLPGGYTLEVLPTSPTGTQGWNYPGLLLLAPWGVVSLPFFPTVAMIVVGVGVGLGMTIAVLLTLRLLRPAPGDRARSKAVGAVTGLTPAMLSLVTLGACCSTTAVATAGVGLVADASATSVSNLLLNNWYLGVFQIVVVWVSLLGQEMLLSVYGSLYGKGPARAGTPRTSLGSPYRWALGGTLRVLLLAGGILWSLAVLAAWTLSAPAGAGPALWFSWGVQHEAVGLFAVALALAPGGVLRAVLRARRSLAGRVALGSLLAGAVSLLLWLPSPLPSWGLDSLPDRLLGLFGVAPAWGAVATPGLPPYLTGLRIALEYGLLAVVSVVAVARPGTLLRLLEEPGPASPAAVALTPPERAGGPEGGSASVRGSGPATAPAGATAPALLVPDADGT